MRAGRPGPSGSGISTDGARRDQSISAPGGSAGEVPTSAGRSPRTATATRRGSALPAAEGPGHLGREDTPHLGGFGQLQHAPHHSVTTVCAGSCASSTAAYPSSTIVYL